MPYGMGQTTTQLTSVHVQTVVSCTLCLYNLIVLTDYKSDLKVIEITKGQMVGVSDKEDDVFLKVNAIASCEAELNYC